MASMNRTKRASVSVGYNLDPRLQAGVEIAAQLFGKQVSVVQASILHFLRLPMNEQADAVKAAALFTRNDDEQIPRPTAPVAASA